jgi:hypothetical protein
MFTQGLVGGDDGTVAHRLFFLFVFLSAGCVERSSKLVIPIQGEALAGTVLQRGDNLAFFIEKDGRSISQMVPIGYLQYSTLKEGDFVIRRFNGEGIYVLLDASQVHFNRLPSTNSSTAWVASVLATTHRASIRKWADSLRVDTETLSDDELLTGSEFIDIQILASVKIFDLQAPVTPENVEKLQHLPALETLIIGNREVNEDSLKSLASVRSLDKLNLAYSRLNIDSVFPLRKLSHLSTVTLSKRQVSRFGIDPIRKQLPSTKVQVLDMRDD